VPFLYNSGKEIRKGDRVTYHGAPGHIEFIAEKITGDPGIDYYVKEHSGGVMIVEPKSFGRMFLHDTEIDEDLVLVARSD